MVLGRVYTNALLLVILATVFGVWVINGYPAFAMTVGGGLVAGFATIAVVFAGRKRASAPGWSPVDVNVLVVVLAIGALLISLVLADNQEAFLARALDALLGASVGSLIGITMAFAKQDAD